MRQKLEASALMSRYMHFAMKEKHENLWIAQRQGRAQRFQWPYPRQCIENDGHGRWRRCHRKTERTEHRSARYLLWIWPMRFPESQGITTETGWSLFPEKSMKTTWSICRPAFTDTKDASISRLPPVWIMNWTNWKNTICLNVIVYRHIGNHRPAYTQQLPLVCR